MDGRGFSHGAASKAQAAGTDAGMGGQQKATAHTHSRLKKHATPQPPTHWPRAETPTEYAKRRRLGRVCFRGLCKEPFNVMRAKVGCVPQKAFEYRYTDKEPRWVADQTEYDYAMFFCGRMPLMRNAWILLKCSGPVGLEKGPFTVGPFRTSAPLVEGLVSFAFNRDCFKLPLGVLVEAHKHGII
jgi:hypothetical protein